jgi:hypothetical protein
MPQIIGRPATVLKRQPQRFVGDRLRAEISEKQARSIKYQLTIAKLPLAKDVDDFTFKDPIEAPSRIGGQSGPVATRVSIGCTSAP